MEKEDHTNAHRHLWYRRNWRVLRRGGGPVPGAAQAMRPMVGLHTFVLPLQNGVEAPSQLAEVLGVEHVLGGLCGLMVSIAGPGHIRHWAVDPFIGFGELDNHPSERVDKLSQFFF